MSEYEVRGFLIISEKNLRDSVRIKVHNRKKWEEIRRWWWDSKGFLMNRMNIMCVENLQ